MQQRPILEKDIGPGKAIAPEAGPKHIELSAIHNFAAKLCQPPILPAVKEYVRWHARVRREGKGLEEVAGLPDFAPVSINLDLSTSCNFACDHCVDMPILNRGTRFDHEQLLASLKLMSDKGLKAVIVIGGGEPTVYPKFAEVIRFMKALGLHVSVVSNGSGNKRIAEIADCLGDYDWVRLSLDAGSNEVFTAMHKPRKPITLDEICQWVPEIKAINSRFKLGFSFVVTWKGASIHEYDVVENVHEMVLAAQRAKKYGFDYIAFKPFLTRAQANNAEIVDLKDNQDHFSRIIALIQKNVEEAKQLETPQFRVYATTNLKVLINRSALNYMHQPHRCHMQFFRQVLSPLGTFNCPAYRNQPHGRLGDKTAYATRDDYSRTLESTARKILSFDAQRECREVTCLYNHVNWWLEDSIDHPQNLDDIAAADIEPDYFL